MVDTASLSQLLVRIFLLDPAPEMRGPSGLHFLHNLFARVAPAVFEIYRARRVRSEISVLERASLARELHDGTIQSLIAIELELQLLRDRAEREGSVTGGQLEAVQESLRAEILNLRHSLQRLKHVSLGSQECVQALRCVAAQLECESGIATRFESDVDALLLPPPVRVEVVRIVQEALVNVRKHSGAGSAQVRLTSSDGYYRLEIRDDGKGFDFGGKLSLLELDAEEKGPAVLRERVRLIGGDLELESVPGKGSRLEIRVPCRKAPLGYHGSQQG
jgi:signal transduction histidine kinase